MSIYICCFKPALIHWNTPVRAWVWTYYIACNALVHARVCVQLSACAYTSTSVFPFVWANSFVSTEMHAIQHVAFACLPSVCALDIFWEIFGVNPGALFTMTSYHQISRSLKAARLDVIIIVSLWNLTGISVALLSTCRGACQISERLD